jgi:RNA polymerase sigma factor (sigma-70 family)
VTRRCETIISRCGREPLLLQLVSDSGVPIEPVKKTKGEPASQTEQIGDGQNALADIHSLTRAIVKGDEAAFGEFYERFSGRLYGLLLFLTSGREEIAREVLQTTMIKVARKFRVFEHDAALWAWLSQVARNALVDYIRERSRLPNPVSIDLVNSSVGAPGVAEEELLEWLEGGLDQLDEEERALVESVYFQRRQQRELADESGTTQKAIESKLARIRAKLRRFVLQRIKNERRTI